MEHMSKNMKTNWLEQGLTTAVPKQCRKEFAHIATDATMGIAIFIMFLLQPISYRHPASYYRANALLEQIAQMPPVYSITPALSPTKRAILAVLLLLLRKQIHRLAMARPLPVLPLLLFLLQG